MPSGFPDALAYEVASIRHSRSLPRGGGPARGQKLKLSENRQSMPRQGAGPKSLHATRKISAQAVVAERTDSGEDQPRSPRIPCERANPEGKAETPASSDRDLVDLRHTGESQFESGSSSETTPARPRQLEQHGRQAWAWSRLPSGEVHVDRGRLPGKRVAHRTDHDRLAVMPHAGDHTAPNGRCRIPPRRHHERVVGAGRSSELHRQGRVPSGTEDQTSPPVVVAHTPPSSETVAARRPRCVPQPPKMRTEL